MPLEAVMPHDAVAMPHSWVLDGAAITAIVAAIWGAIPTVVALLAGVYYCLLIYGWFKHRHAPEVHHDGS